MIPDYMLTALKSQYGEPLTGQITDGFSRGRIPSLRLNPLHEAPAATLARLQEAGLQPVPVPWYADAFQLPGVLEDTLAALPSYEAGAFYLQGLSAMLPALLLAPEAGESVLDMCAAPGGKSAQLSALSGGRASLTCCERDAPRAERLRFNLRRQGVRQVTVLQQDARQLDDGFRFSRILLDAPCTGSGTLDLRPGAKPRRMEAAWVKRTVQTQAALMRKAMRLLASGGRLVYSTCSILEEENEAIVRLALADPHFHLVSVPESRFPGVPWLPVTLPGTLCVRPTEAFEGFFAAVLEKD